MKQRMINTFTRKFKNPILAKFLTEIGYFLILVYYFIARVFLLKKKNEMIINEDQIAKAKDKISEIRKKPDMDCEIINREIDKKIDLSIIIPAYNVEQYVDECLQSIINQRTEYSCEIIIINDGATDDTELRIKNYTDKRINYIVQENQGLSGARNTGINVARGKYIMFVDSDDVMTANSIQIMMDAIVKNNADIVVGSYYTFCNDIKIKQNHINKLDIIENNVQKSVKNHGYAWGKVYRREMFEKIRFPMEAWYEDTLVCSILYRKCNKMIVLDDIVYGYRINPNGISQTARSSVKSLDHYWVMEHTLKQAESVGLKNDTIQYDIVTNHMSTFLYRRISLMPDDVIKSAFVMACDMLNKIRPNGYEVYGKIMKKDLERAYKAGNYKLWKTISFLI